LPYAATRDQKDRDRHPSIVRQELRGITSGTDCAVPMTVIIHLGVDPDLKIDDGIGATTSATFNPGLIRSN
jgi:hypothetical protein